MQRVSHTLPASALLAFFVIGCGLLSSAHEADAQPKDPPSKPQSYADVLGKLPSDLTPKDSSDTLRFEQANAWWKKNVVGERAVWEGPDAKAVTFKLGEFGEHKGTYRASFNAKGAKVPSIKLNGVAWPVSITDPKPFMVPRPEQYSFSVVGLSEKAAEEIRGWPDKKPLRIEFKVVSVRFIAQGRSSYVSLVIDEITVSRIGVK